MLATLPHFDPVAQIKHLLAAVMRKDEHAFLCHSGVVEDHWSTWHDGRLLIPTCWIGGVSKEDIARVCTEVNDETCKVWQAAMSALSYNIRFFENKYNVCTYYLGLPSDVQALVRAMLPGSKMQFGGIDIIDAGPFERGAVFSNPGAGRFMVFPTR